MIKATFAVFCALCLSSTVFGLDMAKYEEFLTQVAPKNKYFVQQFDEYVSKILKVDPNYLNYNHLKLGDEFTCEKDSDPTIPTSVHRLRPQDIKVVGALGDSLTAALGAKADTIFGLTTEYRGVSWSMGGDNTFEKVLTLPNILRKFNPNVYGFNTGTTSSLFAKEGKGFNVAVSGEEANHMPEQAQRLVDRIKESKQVDFDNDWKMITLFIGGNDLCDYCKDKNLHSPKQYLADIQGALDILYNLPRTFVNLVTVLRVSEIQDLNLNLVCNGLHAMVCPCAAYPDSKEEEDELIQVQTAYQDLIEDLVNSGRYEQRDDFTVVVQPFFKDFSIPRLPDGDVDISFFAPDCFHLSTKGHAAAAVALWNNLLQPVGEKQTTTDPDDKINCPSKDFPYFYTSKNSKNL